MIFLFGLFFLNVAYLSTKGFFNFIVLSLSLDDTSDEEEEEEESPSSTSRPHHSPDERGQPNPHVDAGGHQTTEKPWLSPCVVALPGRTKAKMKLRQSKLHFSSSAVDNTSGQLPDDDDVKPGRRKTKPVTHTITSGDDGDPPSCLSSAAVAQSTQVHQGSAKDVIFHFTNAERPPPKTKRRATLSALAWKSTLPSESLSVPPSLPAVEQEDNDVFEDYFSPANQHPIQTRPHQSIESRINLPFELASLSGKSRRRKSETLVPNTNNKRRQKEMQSSKSSSDRQCSDARDKPTTCPQVADPFPSVTVVGPSDGLARPAQTKSRRKTLNMDDFKTQVVKHRIPSNPKKLSPLGPVRGSASCGQPKQSGGNTMESE